MRTMAPVHVLLAWLCVGCLYHGVNALDNGLARVPPMGWLSWERFRCEMDCDTYPDTCVSEKLYMTMGERMVRDGYRDAGWEYVHIDDCWMAPERDANGNLQADPVRFPRGIKPIADYLHANGLKLGIYTDIGYMTCAKFPGSEFHMEQDANTFAAWGVDLVKTDGCYADLKEMDTSYPVFGMYLNKTGRPMAYGCSWPSSLAIHNMTVDYARVREHCNFWRNYDDVQDSWDSVLNIVDFYGDNKQNFANFSGPGGFSDPDQLLVGDYGLSIYQQRAQFGMFAMLASPMFMSVDLRTIDPAARAILLNKDVIAINQDPLGRQALRLYEVPGSLSVWLKPLAGTGRFAVAILNKDNQGKPMPFKLALGDIGLTSPGGYNVTDVFFNVNIGMFKPSAPMPLHIDPTGILLMKAVAL